MAEESAARDAVDAKAPAKEKLLEEKAFAVREAADAKALAKAEAKANNKARLEEKALVARKAAEAKAIAKEKLLEEKALAARDVAEAKAIAKAEAKSKMAESKAEEKARLEEKALAAREVAEAKALAKKTLLEKKTLATREAAKAKALAKEKLLEEKTLAAREATEAKALAKAEVKGAAKAKLVEAKAQEKARMEEKALAAREGPRQTCNRTQVPRPNILFIQADDFAKATISAYESHLSPIVKTPHIDALAAEGAIFEKSFVTNYLCAPSRTVILTRLHSHENSVIDITQKGFQMAPGVVSYPEILRGAGYTTAQFGKYHSRDFAWGSRAFEFFRPFEKHVYWNPSICAARGTSCKPERFKGFETAILSRLARDWLRDQRSSCKPFYLEVLRARALHLSPSRLSRVDFRSCCRWISRPRMRCGRTPQISQNCIEVRHSPSQRAFNTGGGNLPMTPRW